MTRRLVVVAGVLVAALTGVMGAAQAPPLA
jgi:hypothetical protein